MLRRGNLAQADGQLTGVNPMASANAVAHGDALQRGRPTILPIPMTAEIVGMNDDENQS